MFLYRGFHKVSAIGPGDPIVLAEFTNTTGDTVFDGSLNNALAAGLSQSPYLTLLTPQKVSATLKTMERPPRARLTKDVAGEVCVRSGSKAFIVGPPQTLFGIRHEAQGQLLGYQPFYQPFRIARVVLATSSPRGSTALAPNVACLTSARHLPAADTLASSTATPGVKGQTGSILTSNQRCA